MSLCTTNRVAHRLADLQDVLGEELQFLANVVGAALIADTDAYLATSPAKSDDQTLVVTSGAWPVG